MRSQHFFRSRWLIVVPALLASIFSFIPSASADPVPGLSTSYYTIDVVPPVMSDSVYPLCGSEVENNINRSYDGEPYLDCTYDLFMVHMTGFITIPEHQTIEFWLASDDGGTIKIGTEEWGTWNDQGCSATESGQIDISAGSQPLDVWMYENGGGTCLMLAWNIDNQGWQMVPDEAFTTDYQQPVQTTIPDTTIPDTTIPGTTIPTTTSTTTTTTTIPEKTTTWTTSTTTTSTTVAPTTVPATNPSTTTTLQTTMTTTTIQVPTVTTSTSEVPETTTTTSTVAEATSTTVETTTTLAAQTTESTESSTTTTTEAPTTTSTLPPKSNETSSTSSSSSTTTTSTTTTTLPPPPTTAPEPPQAPQTSQPAKDAPLPPIADKAVVEALAKIEEATPAEVKAIVTELLTNALTTNQAVSVASEPAVLAVLTNDEAAQVFEQVAVEELTSEQAVELVAAVQEAPTKVRKAFEAVLNLFEGFADDYTMTNQTVPIKTRRALIALGAVFLVSAPAPTRRKTR